MTGMQGLGWRQAGLAGLGLAQAGLLYAVSGHGAVAELPGTLGAAALGCTALVWLACDPHFNRLSIWFVWLLAVLVRGVAACATPLLEDDHYRYLWDGMRTALSFDPYRLPPSAYFGLDLEPRWQDILSGINYPDITTIYGPVLQGLFALGYWISPGRIGGIQAILVAVDLAALGILVMQRVPVRWLCAYALHPLILKEAVATAHPDGVVGLFVLAALWMWQVRRPWLMGLLLGAAIATKVSALVVLPLLCWRPAGAPMRAADWVAASGLGCLGGLACLYLPFVLTGQGSGVVALQVFASQWRFNPLLFRVIEALSPATWARGIAAMGIICITGWLAWRSHAKKAWPPVEQALTVLLAFAPAVNPWYWLWALGPAILRAQVLVPIMALVSVVSYINTTVLVEAGWAGRAPIPFAIPWSLTALQLLVLAWLVWRIFINHRRNIT